MDDKKFVWRTETLKDWTLAILTVLFLLLYTAALFGWVKRLSDVTMISRLEPIVFIIVGYYFGRLPAHQNERSLKEETARYRDKSEAAVYARETVQQEREALEEKIRNARAALVSDVTKAALDNLENTGELKFRVRLAVRILDS